MTIADFTTICKTDQGDQSHILVIGPALFETIVRIAGNSRIRHAPTCLAAMGELGIGRFDMVLCEIKLMAGLIESTAQGLRRLAPQSQLIVVAESHQREDAIRAINAGFDQYLIGPLEPQQISGVLGGEQRASNSDPIATVVAELDDAELGDLDLVQHLMKGDGQLQSLAVRMLKSRIGIVGVEFACESPSTIPGQILSTVGYRGKNYGVLQAPSTADPQTLASWANWLGTWLAAEDQIGQLKALAMRDELTGAWNRRYFNRFLSRILQRATGDPSQVTLLVFDIDDFKLYNDRYGHAAGDEILREAARLMQDSVREHDVVARIGGDEFAVIFWDSEAPRNPNSTHPHDVAKAAKRFQRAICDHKFPKLLNDAPGTLTISGGLASFPGDGQNPDQLLEQADAMALRSKQQGKNAITFGPGAMRYCETEMPK